MPVATHNGDGKRLRLALLQWSAGPRADENLGRLDEWLENGPDADIIALPEVVAARGADCDLRRAAEPVPGSLVEWFAARARRRSAWILLGSMTERVGNIYYNTSVLLNRRGEISAVYRKIHLFEAFLPDGTVIRESDFYQAGAAPVMADIEGRSGGLSICYDLRFPELYRHYSACGAQWIAIPANFTRHTGRDHWEILVRARAIENQCFIIAPNQCGVNAVTGVAAYGHSLIVGPWGEIMAQAGDEEQWLTADICDDNLRDVRRRLPALDHRRSDTLRMRS